MKTNKNVVRLTESKLKAMVAESVREALNEIDWGGLSHDEWNTFRREANDIHDSDYDDDYELDEYDKAHLHADLCGSYEFDIRIGKYDDKIFDDEWVEHMLSIFDGYPMHSNSLYKTIERRRNELKAQNESKLRKIVSESIDRVLKNK